MQCTGAIDSVMISSRITARQLPGYAGTTQGRGITLRPDSGKSFEVYADADFTGAWFKEEAV